MRTIYTHQHPDLDALASLWAVLAFAPGFSGARWELVPANWDGALLNGDIAVDLEAGGRGIKGTLDEQTGIRSSSFASIIERFAPPEAQEALAPLVRFIDARDTCGEEYLKRIASDLDPEAEEVLDIGSLSTTLKALRRTWKHDDVRITELFLDIFEGLYREQVAWQKSKKAAKAAQKYGPNGEVAINDNGRAGSSKALYREGVMMVVYINGNDLGVVTQGPKPHVRADHTEIVKAIQAAGEEMGGGGSEWFPHSAGFLCCRGSAKAPAPDKSKVKPMDLVEACLRAIERSRNEVAGDHQQQF